MTIQNNQFRRSQNNNQPAKVEKPVAHSMSMTSASTNDKAGTAQTSVPPVDFGGKPIITTA